MTATPAGALPLSTRVLVIGAGAMGSGIAHVAARAGHTVYLYDMSADAVARGATDLVMEVSSHALAQARVAPLRYHAVGLTSFSQDHLDFHGDMAGDGAAAQ